MESGSGHSRSQVLQWEEVAEFLRVSVAGLGISGRPVWFLCHFAEGRPAVVAVSVVDASVQAH